MQSSYDSSNMNLKHFIRVSLTGVVLLSLAFALFLPKALVGQEVLRFTVKPLPNSEVSPVSISLLPWYRNNLENSLILLDVTHPDNPQETACQMEMGFEPKLWFMFDPANGTRTYSISRLPGKSLPAATIAQVVASQGQYLLRLGQRDLLAYNHAVVMPPEGVNPLYARSGFIHPLRSPGGAVLTRIQPPDHYHHYGIWNPWTKTTVEGQEVDFWNLIKGEGTVQFAGLAQQVGGELYSGILVHHEHMKFEDAYDQVAIKELWDIRLWNLPFEDVYIADLSVVLNTPLEDGVLLEVYRYGGGLGFRSTERWDRYNSTVLTSEGKARAEADGTEARWAIVEGETDLGRSGILFLSHPSNRMHPEPMRVWPEDANEGRGDLFFEFCPIRHHEWKLEHGRLYTLKYRMVVFDGSMDIDRAEAFWESFSKTPVIEFHN